MEFATDSGLSDYSPIIERPNLTWPNGARVAFCVGLNVEHFEIDKPSTSIWNGTLASEAATPAAGARIKPACASRPYAARGGDPFAPRGLSRLRSLRGRSPAGRSQGADQVVAP